MSERHTHASAHGRPKWPVRAMVTCALLTAVSVVLARFLIPTPQRGDPLLPGGGAHLPGRDAVRAAARGPDRLRSRFHRLPVLPLWLQPDFLRAPRSSYGLCAGLFRPWLTRRCSPLRLALAFPAAGDPGVGAVPELRLGHDLWRRRKSRVLSHPAGGPQRAVRHHRDPGRAGGVASAALRRSAGRGPAAGAVERK